MKARDLKLGAVLEFEENQGRITFQGDRFLLMNANAMGLMRREIIAVLGLDMARRLLTRYGYACGYSDALQLRELYKWESEEEWIKAGPMMHTLEGVVKVVAGPLDYSRKADLFDFQGQWHNSFEAEQHIKHLGRSDSPTCWTLTGYASGYTSAFFGRQAVCIERSCLGQGAPYCSWQLARPHQLGDDGQQAVHDLEGFNLAGTISMLEEQIAARTHELSALHGASQVLAESLALDEILQQVLPYILEATRTVFGRIFLLDETGNKLELCVQAEPGDPTQATQLYTTLPVVEDSRWKRLVSGALVIQKDLAAMRLLPELSRRHNWRSLVQVPLPVHGVLRGVMELATTSPNWPGSPDDRRLLLSLGRQIGMALGKARLYEQEQQQAQAWRSLVEIGRKVANNTNTQQVLESLVTSARALLNSELAFVGLINEQEQVLQVTACSGTRNQELKHLRLPFNRGLTQSIMQSKQPFIIQEYARDIRLQGEPTPEVLAENIISMLAVPLTANKTVLGVLYMGERHERFYREAEVDLLLALATQAAISVNITRLHEREINQMKEVERVKEDFLAMITHELRTPLTNIKGISTGLLYEGLELDKTTEQTLLRVISEEADVLTELVSNLLDMSRLEAGSWFIQPEQCTFDEIVEGVKHKLGGILGLRELQIESEPSLPVLKVDLNQIERVLVNLIANALKYSGIGPIRLQARFAQPFWLEIRVSDYGSGIPPEDRPHIFDKFYRVKPNSSQKLPVGAGLGLAIVKGIVEAHGGAIWLADSEVGATFCFTLPVLVNADTSSE